MPMVNIRVRVRLIEYCKLPVSSIYSDSTRCIWPDRDRVVEGSLRVRSRESSRTPTNDGALNRRLSRISDPLITSKLGYISMG
jgi:hypothetical protein